MSNMNYNYPTINILFKDETLRVLNVRTFGLAVHIQKIVVILILT